MELNGKCQQSARRIIERLDYKNPGFRTKNGTNIFKVCHNQTLIGVENEKRQKTSGGSVHVSGHEIAALDRDDVHIATASHCAFGIAANNRC
jgi:hypothetical protein